MKKAFTLIELLVVISIISLLSSIVVTSLNTARAKARDSQRISDMQQYQIALSRAKSDRELPSGYMYLKDGDPGSGTAINRLVNPGYLPSILSDTWGSRGNRYVYRNHVPNHSWVLGDNDPNSYAIRFRTEANSQLGSPGYYCINSVGFHKAGSKPENTTSQQCVQG